MAYLDTRGLGDLWARIDAIFARMTVAAGSLALSGTSLILRSISGADLSSFDLAQTFATKQYADDAASGAAGGKIAADVVVTAEIAAKSTSAFMWSYIVPVLALAYMFVYSAFLSKPPKNIDELVK